MTVRFRSVAPHLHVPDVARTAQYYARVLGFEIEGYWDGERVHHDHDGIVSFAIIRRDGICLHLNSAVGVRTPDADDRGGYNLYFSVDDVDELASELRQRGAEIIDRPADRVYGAREVVVRDCNGLVIAFGAAPETRGQGGGMAVEASEHVAPPDPSRLRRSGG